MWILVLLYWLPSSNAVDKMWISVLLGRWVVELRRVYCELLSKGREWVATWRTTAREWVPGLGDSLGVAWLGMVTLTERLLTA